MPTATSVLPVIDPQKFGLTTRIPDLCINYEPVEDGKATAKYYFLPEFTGENVIPPQQTVNKSFDVYTLRKDFPVLNQTINGKPLIWLDNAATTQKPQVVIDTISKFYSCDNSNIHRGAHTLARKATAVYEEARGKVKDFIGADSTEEIIFTRGATEAINLVAQSFGKAFIHPGDEIILTTLEHHSNIVPWQLLCKEKKATLKIVPLNNKGEILLEEYRKLLSPKTRIVAFSYVSNALGTVLPVKAMIDLAHERDIPVLLDGAQSAPHLKINVKELDTDFYVFSGHKLFGPTGIGVLYGKKALLDAMPPWQSGGNMIENVSFEETTFSSLPAKFEAGTGNIAGAIGLGAAIDYISNVGLENIAAYETELMAYASEGLQKVPGLRQIGTSSHKAAVLSFIIPGISSAKLGALLDQAGIAVRAGHHCAQPALAHFGLRDTIRPSLAFYNTSEEIDELVFALRRAVS